MTLNELNELFAAQLAAATVLTTDELGKMRQWRRERFADDATYQAVLENARLDTDELVGHRLAYYMVRRPDVLEIMKIYDDELEQLTELVYEGMSGNIPKFTEVILETV